MRKKSAARGYRMKGSAAPKNIDEYLAGVPEPARTTLEKMRTTIQTALPSQATETISYGIPAFKLKKILVYFAAFTNHCSFFPTAAIIEEFKDDLAGYTISKGTVQFPTNKPMPAALVKKMVRARVAQHDQKETKKKYR
jgi:uncharacterized protein YdhG (YjbR/CyaY superfamily)